ncbi:hypothetical protein [Streptomyces sp. NPDC054838]
MANEPVTTPIHNLYAQRFAADLETNRKEQADLTAQIEELEGRLEQLKSDESWLCGVQGVLPSAGDPAPPAPTSAGAATTGAVPRPRQAKKSTGGAARARKAAQPKKSSGTAVSATEAKAVARKPAAKAKQTAEAKGTVRTEEPPLRELVHALLSKAAEPRMVSEVTAELAQAHPGRAASGQVVRNTLEGLVKKGQVEKEHRQGSVMYTALRPAAAVAAEPVAEAAVADPGTEAATPAP